MNFYLFSLAFLFEEKRRQKLKRILFPVFFLFVEEGGRKQEKL